VKLKNSGRYIVKKILLISEMKLKKENLMVLRTGEIYIGNVNNLKMQGYKE
jgi:hypothetical protein